MGTKTTERQSAAAEAVLTEKKLDKELRDSFPTSDPPSFTPGAIGAPKARESDSPTPDTPAVIDAEKKVKSGESKKPDKY